MDLNFTDLYIRYPGHPDFSSIEIIEDDALKVIVQKYEMIIFSVKGDVFGQPQLGANLLELLHDTKFSSDDVESEIRSQISKFIPELSGLEYTLSVNFYEHPERFEEFMVIDLTINGVLISAIIK